MSSTLKQATDLRDHGIAVRSGSCLSIRPWRDAETGRDYVYVGIISTSSLVVQVDVQSGRCRSFRMPKPAEGPWGMDFTLDGHVLVTSTGGHLVRINPRTGKAWVTANPGKWLWAVDRGADGKFYLGSSSECQLFRYDAGTERVEDLGSLDAAQKYLRAVIGGQDGYVYGSVGCTAAQVIAYHIASRRITRLLPKSEEQADFHRLARGRDGVVYVRTVLGHLYRLEHGEAFRVPGGRNPWPREGLHYGQAPERLPDGRSITMLDPDAIRIGAGPRARLIPMKYETDGANIFHLAEGPNRTVYGSTIMPLYLARYAPATRKLENLGRGAPDNGEAYSFGHCGGKLYYGCYSYGNLMEYDPAKPLHRDPPGAMKWKDNPRLVSPLGKGHNRPRAMCVDSRKRVWVGSFAEYGLRNGGLGCYDTVRRKYTNNPVVIRNQSIVALAADASGDVLYGGTNIVGGSGTDPVTQEAHLFAWDTRKRKVMWKRVPIPGTTGIQNLLYRDGKLYGTCGNKYAFFRFDPRIRSMDYVVPSEISGAREQSIGFGPDGNIYGITWMSVFRWRPDSGRIEVLYRCTGSRAKRYSGGSLFHRGAVIIAGRLYFSCGPHIMSLRLPRSLKIVE